MQGTPAKAEHDRMHHIMVKNWAMGDFSLPPGTLCINQIVVHNLHTLFSTEDCVHTCLLATRVFILLLCSILAHSGHPVPFNKLPAAGNHVLSHSEQWHSILSDNLVYFPTTVIDGDSSPTALANDSFVHLVGLFLNAIYATSQIIRCLCQKN